MTAWSKMFYALMAHLNGCGYRWNFILRGDELRAVGMIAQWPVLKALWHCNDNEEAGRA